MEKLRSVGKKSKVKSIRVESAEAARDYILDEGGQPIDPSQLLLQYLLPTAVKEFYRRLSLELEELCGQRYRHGVGMARWGSEDGSIYLAGSKVAIRKPRVRDLGKNKEVALSEYERMRQPQVFEDKVFSSGLRDVSQRNYAEGLEKIGASFGFKKSTISEKWKKATKKQLELFQTRKLGDFKIVAVYIDGKRFQDENVVVALGVSETGKKHVLGFYQSSTENSVACLGLLKDLEDRGLPQSGILFIVDGGSGLNKALEEKYSVHDTKKRTAVRARCHVHKWRNLEDHLGKDSPATQEAAGLFWNMRGAKTFEEAASCAKALETVLQRANLSALKSFQEAKQDLLIIHQLPLTAPLKRAFSTTNASEALNSQLGHLLARVRRWHNSEQLHRWLATAALQTEKKMYRLRGYLGLKPLALHLQTLCSHNSQLDCLEEAA